MLSQTMASENNNFVLGETITKMCGTYKVESLLGEGAFGKVVKCIRQTDNKMVAMKVLKKRGNYHYQAEKEVSADIFVKMCESRLVLLLYSCDVTNYKSSQVEALLKFKYLDVDGCNLVQFYSNFMHKDFYCLVFEYLEQSLRDFMKARDFEPLPLSSIRVIAQQVYMVVFHSLLTTLNILQPLLKTTIFSIIAQLGTALQTLRNVGITHTDIKLDNVMMVNHREQPFKVKLIDFGLARNTTDILKGASIQPLAYR